MKLRDTTRKDTVCSMKDNTSKLLGLEDVIVKNVYENETGYTVMIYNNGQPPEREIREGGGLTNLRHRIETEGGRMLVQSFPEFALVIEIPKI